MHDLTQRQIEILKSLIEEYIETAAPVGSETLEKKHNLSASPATIRNEMVRLVDLGYLKKPHTSAGRVPTSTGMKFYVKQLMKEQQMSVAEGVALKERLWDHRQKNQEFMREMVRTLAEKTKAVAIVTTEEGDFYCSGYGNLFRQPEFYDIDVTENFFSAIDEFEHFNRLFATVSDDEEIHILLGDELGPKLKGPYGFVFSHYETPRHMAGEVGVLGPTRLNYMKIVPTVRFCKELIEEIAEGW